MHLGIYAPQPRQSQVYLHREAAIVTDAARRRVLPDGFATRCRSVLCRGRDPDGLYGLIEGLPPGKLTINGIMNGIINSGILKL